MSTYKTVRKPQPGDLADHKSRRLDPRYVARVSNDGQHIWLELPTMQAGPYPASNYTYRREVAEQEVGR